jgi:hypothetical protein
MQYTRLGTSDLSISRIALGCMSVGGSWTARRGRLDLGEWLSWADGGQGRSGGIAAGSGARASAVR